MAKEIVTVRLLVVALGTGVVVRIGEEVGHHPPIGSGILQLGVTSKQAGRGLQVETGATVGHGANSQLGP